MKPLIRTTSANSTVIPIRQPLDSSINNSSFVVRLDELLLTIVRRWSITALRLALGSVFLWFGALKIFGSSPVAALIQETYSFVPINAFMLVLGVWEMVIGIGIVSKRALRCVLILSAVHLIGTFTAIWFKPSIFFVQGVPFCLTVDGEFVMKNLVLIAAALVIAGYEVKPLRRM
ncbi:MAG TPA: DoxX family protein [Pyrinomonadaceae bacterium]|nr:DoxX family protein [Pyrinomonadaceae bacterium]